MPSKTDLPRCLLFVLMILVCVSFALAQKPTPTPDRPRAIVALLNDARLAAPELAVDTFLKVVETKKVTDPVWRKEIIDEALRMIDDVQYAMPMYPAFGGDSEGTIRSLNDTEVFLRAGAHSMKLDRLSFKGRAITLLLETDKERAKQMIFQMGGQLNLKPRTCEDAMTYAPDDIYPVVAKVAKAVFTDRQIAEGQRAIFIAPWFENIESPKQIFAALDLLSQIQGPVAERQMLFNAASRAINRDFKDDRSFTFAWQLIAGRVGNLVGGEADPLKIEFKQAFRGMLLKNLRGTRCKDNEIKRDGPLPGYIDAANKVLSDKPLTIEDVLSSEYSGTPKLRHMLANSAVLKLRDEMIAVRNQKVVDNKIVNHDVNDLEWVAKVNDFIDRILAFDGENHTESEMLFIKGAFLGGMLSGIDPGELRNSILRKYLRQLVGSPLQKTSFIEWRHWIADAERWAPDSFSEIASEFPNPNLKVILAANKLLAEPKKEEPKPAPTPERPREVVALLNDARLAAPELTVETILDLVESKKIKEAEWRRELLEEALRLVGDVKYPVRRRGTYLVQGGVIDTVSGYMAYAYDQKLDSLSLKSRIIKNVLADDKQRARQLVFEIGGNLKLKPLTCEDALVYDVAEIYSVVGLVAGSTFSQTEIEDGHRGTFLLPWVENVESPAQIVPVVQLLSGLEPATAERQLLANAFERSISRSFGDDRSFTRLFDRIGGPVASFITSSGLSAAWRDMLAENTSGPRCIESKPRDKAELPEPVRSFNHMFAEDKRFSPEQFETVEYRGAVRDKLYMQSAAYKKISQLFKAAREKKNLPENKNDKDAQLEWELKVDQTLDLLDSWKAGDGETDAEVFNQKAVWYRTMIPEVSDAKPKLTVIRAFMRYLAGAAIQKDSFIEWHYHTRWLAKTEPTLFATLSEEFPNPNFKVIVAAKKVLGEPEASKAVGAPSANAKQQ